MKQLDFEWRGVEFRWNWQRMAAIGKIPLGGKGQAYWLLVRETLPGTWQSWMEWGGGYTMPCTMASRELALEGATLELQSVFQKLLDDLAPFVARRGVASPEKTP